MGLEMNPAKCCILTKNLELDQEENYPLTAVRIKNARVAIEAPANIDHRMPSVYKPYASEMKE